MYDIENPTLNLCIFEKSFFQNAEGAEISNIAQESWE